MQIKVAAFRPPSGCATYGWHCGCMYFVFRSRDNSTWNVLIRIPIRHVWLVTYFVAQSNMPMRFFLPEQSRTFARLSGNMWLPDTWLPFGSDAEYFQFFGLTEIRRYEDPRKVAHALLDRIDDVLIVNHLQDTLMGRSRPRTVPIREIEEE